MAKPTPKQEKQVTDWYMKYFWPTYPARLCGRGKGSRGIGLKLMLGINPDEQEQKRILGNLKAQIRAADKNPNKIFWKIGETYIRNQLWDDEIESEMEVKAKQDLKICCIENCNSDVHGPSFKHCAEHVPNAHSDLLAKAWETTNIKYKSPTFVDECRKECRNRMDNWMGKVS